MKRSLLILLIALAGCIEPIDVSDLSSPPDAAFRPPDAVDLEEPDDANLPTEDVTEGDRDAATGALVILLIGEEDGGQVEPLLSHLKKRGYNPVVLLESAFPPATADFVIVTHSVIGGGSFESELALRWNKEDVPFLVLEIPAADELGILRDSTLREKITGHAHLVISEEDHPLSGGFSGETRIFTSPQENYCVTEVLPGSTIAALAGEDLGCVASIWEAPPGTVLRDGTARTTPRAALALGDDGAIEFWTEDAWKLFDAAVDHLSQSAP